MGILISGWLLRTVFAKQVWKLRLKPVDPLIGSPLARQICHSLTFNPSGSSFFIGLHLSSVTTLGGSTQTGGVGKGARLPFTQIIVFLDKHKVERVNPGRVCLQVKHRSQESFSSHLYELPLHRLQSSEDQVNKCPTQKLLPVPLSHEQGLACSGDLALRSWCLEEVDLVYTKGKFTEECTRFPVLAWGTVTTYVSGVVTNSSTVCLALQFLPSVF